MKVSTELSGKETTRKKIPKKLFHNYLCLGGHLGFDDWNFTLFEQFETHKQLKERENLLAELT